MGRGDDNILFNDKLVRAPRQQKPDEEDLLLKSNPGYPLLRMEREEILFPLIWETTEEIGEQRTLACLGGGSNALGGFYAFLKDPVELVAVEAAGQGLDSEKHGASLERGSPGILHGSKSMILQNEEGQVLEAHSVSAGLDYPGVGPEHAYLLSEGHIEAVGATDAEALAALKRFAGETGILPALETSHALGWYYREQPPGNTLLVLSGRGDKDLGIIEQEDS